MQRKMQYRGLPYANTENGSLGLSRKPGGVNALVLLAVSVAMLLAGALVGGVTPCYWGFCNQLCIHCTCVPPPDVPSSEPFTRQNKALKDGCPYALPKKQQYLRLDGMRLECRSSPEAAARL